MAMRQLVRRLANNATADALTPHQKPLKTSLLYLSLGLFLAALALFAARALLRRAAARRLQAARHVLSSSGVDDATGERAALVGTLRRRVQVASVLAFCALWYATSISFTLYNKFVLYYWEGGPSTTNICRTNENAHAHTPLLTLRPQKWMTKNFCTNHDGHIITARGSPTPCVIQNFLDRHFCTPCLLARLRCATIVAMTNDHNL